MKNLREIRLAREAIGVPRPPRSTPSSSPRQSSVNPAHSTDAGTLLINWLATAEVKRALLDISPSNSVLSAGISPRFPENIKKNTKVISRL